MSKIHAKLGALGSKAITISNVKAYDLTAEEKSAVLIVSECLNDLLRKQLIGAAGHDDWVASTFERTFWEYLKAFGKVMEFANNDRYQLSEDKRLTIVSEVDRAVKIIREAYQQRTYSR